MRTRLALDWKVVGFSHDILPTTSILAVKKLNIVVLFQSATEFLISTAGLRQEEELVTTSRHQNWTLTAAAASGSAQRAGHGDSSEPCEPASNQSGTALPSRSTASSAARNCVTGQKPWRMPFPASTVQLTHQHKSSTWPRSNLAYAPLAEWPSGGSWWALTPNLGSRALVLHQSNHCLDVCPVKEWCLQLGSQKQQGTDCWSNALERCVEMSKETAAERALENMLRNLRAYSNGCSLAH